jgi:hypothetical protein
MEFSGNQTSDNWTVFIQFGLVFCILPYTPILLVLGVENYFNNLQPCRTNINFFNLFIL